MKKFLVIFALFASAANAATWYIRPAGSTYGTGDGLSYANARAGNAAAGWGGMANGDIVYLCGAHREIIRIAKDQLTIRLDCPNDPATLYGSDLVNAWSRVGQEWQTSFPVRPLVIAVNGVVLRRGSAVGSLQPGQFLYSGAGPYTVSIRLADDSSPIGKTVEVGRRARALQIGNVSTDTFTSLSIQGGNVGSIRYVGAIDGSPQSTTQNAGKCIATGDDGWAATNFSGTLRIEGVTFDGCSEQAFHFNQVGAGTPSVVAMTISKNRAVQIGGETFYVKTNSGSVTFEDNNIGSATLTRHGWNSTLDNNFKGDVFDVTTATATPVIRIRRNYAGHSNGAGVVLGTASLSVTVEDNTFEDLTPETAGAWNYGTCFELDPQAAVASSPVWTFQHNRCLQPVGDGAGITIRGSAGAGTPMTFENNLIVTSNAPGLFYGANNGNNNTFRHNTFVNTASLGAATNANVGMYLSAGLTYTNFVSYENIVVACYPVRHSQAATTGQTWQRNGFHAPCGAASPFKWGNVDYTTIFTAQTALAFITNSFSANPAFDARYNPSATSGFTGVGVKWWGTNPRPTDLYGRAYHDTIIDLGAVQTGLGRRFAPSQMQGR